MKNHEFHKELFKSKIEKSLDLKIVNSQQLCNLCVFYYLSAVALNQIYNDDDDKITNYGKITNFEIFPIIVIKYYFAKQNNILCVIGYKISKKFIPP